MSRHQSRTLSIRSEQIDAVMKPALAAFEDWVFGHVRKHFAGQLAERSDDNVRTLVREGLRRGWAQGLRMKLTLCQFVDLCVLFGLGFESDPTHRWVTRAVEHPGATTPDETMILMTMYAIEHLGVSDPQPVRRGLEEGF